MSSLLFQFHHVKKKYSSLSTYSNFHYYCVCDFFLKMFVKKVFLTDVFIAISQTFFGNLVVTVERKTKNFLIIDTSTNWTNMYANCNYHNIIVYKTIRWSHTLLLRMKIFNAFPTVRVLQSVTRGNRHSSTTPTARRSPVHLRTRNNDLRSMTFPDIETNANKNAPSYSSLVPRSK